MVLQLFQKSERAAADIQALMFKARTAASSVMHGSHGRKQAGSGEKFWQFREYTHDDEPRMIDWRQSAKGARVYVKQKEWQTAHNVFFWCKSSPGMDFSSSLSLPSKMEQGQILSLSLGMLAVEGGENVGPVYSPRTGHSEKSLENLAIALTTSSAESFPDFTRVLSLKNSYLVLVSDFLEPFEEIDPLFKSLSEIVQGALIVQVLDPVEIDLPYDGHVNFSDPAGFLSAIRLTNVGSVRAEYKERVQNHIDKLQTLCLDLGWVYSLSRTDEAVESCLRAISRQLEERVL